MCVAKVNDGLQLESIEVWYDPMAMFRQMKPIAEGLPAADINVLVHDEGGSSQVTEQVMQAEGVLKT